MRESPYSPLEEILVKKACFTEDLDEAKLNRRKLKGRNQRRDFMSFERLTEMVAYLKDNPAILSIILTGSVSLGAEDEQSDVDLLIIYAGETEPEIEFPPATWEWDIRYETVDQLQTVGQLVG